MQIFADTNRLKARSLLGLLVMGFGVLAFDGGAIAQSASELNNRIGRLEKEIQTLNRALFRGEKPPASAYSGGTDAAAQADLEIRLSQLETELRNIRGQMEEQGYAMRQLREELERVKGDLEMRVQELEGNGGASSGPAGGTVKYINRSGALNNGTSNVNSNSGASNNAGYQWSSGNTQQLGSYNETPDTGAVSSNSDLATATYENAFALLKKDQYETAEKEFSIFLTQYPDHPLAGNAQYWLGETYYVRGNYDKAARVFAEGFQKYPKNSKAADNLLKLGMSLAAMDKKDDACVAISQIGKEGFQAASNVLRRAEQEKTRLGC
jgi:tol-pal system protein YbgF